MSKTLEIGPLTGTLVQPQYNATTHILTSGNGTISLVFTTPPTWEFVQDDPFVDKCYMHLNSLEKELEAAKNTTSGAKSDAR